LLFFFSFFSSFLKNFFFSFLISSHTILWKLLPPFSQKVAFPQEILVNFNRKKKKEEKKEQ